MNNSIDDYLTTKKMAELNEIKKITGQLFCNTFNWRLDKYLTVVQRPDKIICVDGAIHRTITPITHIWYRSKTDFSHNIWVEFEGKTIIVKNRIKINLTRNGFNQLLQPDPTEFKDNIFFWDQDDAFNYIMTLI